MINKRIMIIDDDKEFLDELTEVLNLSGYEVFPFTDGQIALDQITEHVTDIILLDLKMEGINGFQVANKVMHSSNIKDIPIIAMTGFFTLKEHSMLMRINGIKKAFIKPFNFEELVAEIENILNEKQLVNKADF